jgi:hypothetical protein
MFGRHFAASAWLVISGCLQQAAAASGPEGWWGASDAPITIEGRRPSFEENWYIVLDGAAVCALRVNGMDGTVSGLRVYRGSVDRGHMTLYKGQVLLGRYAKELEKLGPLDPFHFFVGASSLVLRLQVAGDERADRFIVLRRLGDLAEDLMVRSHAQACRGKPSRR